MNLSFAYDTAAPVNAEDKLCAAKTKWKAATRRYVTRSSVMGDGPELDAEWAIFEAARNDFNRTIGR
jgi:hypothetical protein